MSRDGDATVVCIPVRFHRRNGRQSVLTHGGNNGDDEGESIGTLIAAIAKAYRWQEQLKSGEGASLEDLASADGVDRTYVGRMEPQVSAWRSFERISSLSGKSRRVLMVGSNGMRVERGGSRTILNLPVRSGGVA